MTAAQQVRPGLRPSTEAVNVAETFTALMRSFIKARAQLLAAAAHDVEWSAQILLRCLANEGPMRSSTLAELVESDPSTVSRQVAALVKDGLVQRQADPIDGRASLLVLTAKADQVRREQDDFRNTHFERMLADWSEPDRHRFAGLLWQFTTDFNRHKNEWLPMRADHRPASAEGTS